MLWRCVFEGNTEGFSVGHGTYEWKCVRNWVMYDLHLLRERGKIYPLSKKKFYWELPRFLYLYESTFRKLVIVTQFSRSRFYLSTSWKIGNLGTDDFGDFGDPFRSRSASKGNWSRPWWELVLHKMNLIIIISGLGDETHLNNWCHERFLPPLYSLKQNIVQQGPIPIEHVPGSTLQYFASSRIISYVNNLKIISSTHDIFSIIFHFHSLL